MIGITLHVLADRLDNPQIDRLITHVGRVKMPYITITGGARIDTAMKIVERIREASPATRAIFRQGDDDGLWKKKSVEQWYDERVAPHRAWLRANNVIFMPDNESLEDDLKPYAHWMAQAIMKCAVDDIKLAVGTFSTGNPRENQYAQLDEMWHALAAYGGVWMPHEYFGMTPQLSAGHLNRYMLGWNRCNELGVLTPPVTVIGESGLCKSTDGQLDPYTGFRKLDISDADYAHNFVIPTYEAWYKARGVSMCIFSYGDWDKHGFDVGVEYLEIMEVYAIRSAAAPVITQPIAHPPGLPPVITPPAPPPPPVPIDPATIVPIELPPPAKSSLTVNVSGNNASVSNFMTWLHKQIELSSDMMKVIDKSVSISIIEEKGI
jgi:hypothetical protein